MSKLEYSGQDDFSETLDIPRTRQNHGRQFCFVRTSKREGGIVFPTPKISHPCYGPNKGADPVEAAERAEMLKPLQP
jgi:hypothetical protein